MRQSFNGYEKDTRSFEFELPEQCPMCHKKIAPRFIDGFREENESVSIMFYCNGCKHSFIGRYKDTNFKKTNGFYELDLIKCEPIQVEKIAFSKQIASLSERFTNVYNQAYEADQLGLTEIAGVGYRKALEILVKDFAIWQHPEKMEEIKKAWLSKCISEFVDNSDIQVLANASIDIGNDETHYEKLYEDCNIEDMKAFIEAAVSLIESKIKTKEAVDLLNNHKAQRSN